MPNGQPLRRLVTKCYSYSQLTAHFIESSAKLLGISQSEFARRIADDALMEWTKHQLYQLPAEYQASDRTPLPQPSVHKLAVTKRTQHLRDVSKGRE